MNETQTWLFDQLSRLHCRARGLPDPAPLAADEPPPQVAEQVAEISPDIARVLDLLAVAGVRPEPEESLAQALARALFDGDGTPNALGVAFFGEAEVGDEAD